jgi:carboxyl-terminal processing protease
MPSSNIAKSLDPTYGTVTKRDTQSELANAMAELKRQRMKGYILDLRGNPGGLFNSAVEIANLYIEKGLLVTFRKRCEEQKIMCAFRGRFSHVPMVCLLDGESARASEIVAACLQDHQRAIIVGERSRGDGEIQTIIDLPHGTLQFTTAAFYRPSGKPLSKTMTSGKEEDDWGVRPDKGFAVKLSPQERKELAEHRRQMEIIAPFNPLLKPDKPAFRDRQLDKAVEYLQKQIRHASP